MRVSSLRSVKGKREVTRVFYGVETVISTVIQFLNQTNNVVYACVDQTRPILTLDILVLKNAFLDAKNRGVKFMYITEITKDNLPYCKQLVKMTHELRHLDGIKGNFYISESGYLAPATYHEKGKPASQIIYSNVNEIIEHQKYVFDSFWNRAISAEERIKEIEEVVTRYETKLIQEKDKIINEIVRIIQSSNEFSICTTAGGIQFAYNYLFEVTNKLLDRYKKGEHKGVRYITYIDIDNVKIAKILLDSGVQIKHVRNLPPMSFGVSDKEIEATIEKLEYEKAVQSLLVSNEPMYVKHFSSIFEELWKNGVDAKSRIRDIEEGVDTPGIDIIQNPYEIQELAFKLVKSAQKEIRIMYSTANAFHRQEYAGAIQLLKEAIVQRGIKFRILTPKDDLIEEKAQKLIQQQIDIRYIEPSSQTKVSIIVADNNSSLSVELKDDTKRTSYDAVGLATYSNSKPTVLSYISIFESLWKEADLYQQLENSNKELAAANEKLKESDKIQKEFINVAAHELRTPIQPILGLSEVLQSKIRDNEQRVLVDVISRNAKRLQRLTEDILDITRIESQSLNLNKEIFNLNEIIMSILAEYESQTRGKNNVKITFASKGDSIVEGDRGRLTQVLSNFISNAIKFTQEGNIDISLEKMQDDKAVVLSVKDTGSGIEPDIMPRLFTKFATKSHTGTGLGLYISKSIIEAHGGRIWAENNPDGKGATFTFTLPLVYSSL
ncbi:MAG TPA: HAMP domain-containing sensor histidine kinase [Nitrososphaeraceae archaeon]|nr:HAMP domain-containing sensor histidine kinase [Nitrososphaeraceae archaeon]